MQEPRREVRCHEKGLTGNKLYRYFTYKKTYRFVNVLQEVVKAYNNTVHTAHVMVTAAATDKHVLEVWGRMNDGRSHVRKGRFKFNVGQHIRISKEKMNSQTGRNKIILTRYFE